MITLKLYWWFAPIILFLIPIIQITFHKDSDWDMNFTGLILMALCWPGALFIIITRLLS